MASASAVETAVLGAISHYLYQSYVPCPARDKNDANGFEVDDAAERRIELLRRVFLRAFRVSLA